MNDRYLYRAKRTDDGEWVEGFLVKGKWYFGGKEICAILPLDLCFFPYCEISEWIEIDQSTICQCTGLRDKNGKMIWENDVVKIDGVVYICFWNESNFEWGFKNNAEDFGVAYISSDDIQIVGNIFDNPELLEK